MYNLQVIEQLLDDIQMYAGDECSKKTMETIDCLIGMIKAELDIKDTEGITHFVEIDDDPSYALEV